MPGWDIPAGHRHVWRTRRRRANRAAQPAVAARPERALVARPTACTTRAIRRNTTGNRIARAHDRPTVSAARLGPETQREAAALGRSAVHGNAARDTRDDRILDPLLRSVVPALAVLREDARSRLQRVRHLQPHVSAGL